MGAPGGHWGPQRLPDGPGRPQRSPAEAVRQYKRAPGRRMIGPRRFGWPPDGPRGLHDAPRGVQEHSQERLQRHTSSHSPGKTHIFSTRGFSVFTGPKRPPRPPQDGPRGPQEGPNGPRGPRDSPRAAQDSLKTAPRSPNSSPDGPRTALDIPRLPPNTAPKSAQEAQDALKSLLEPPKRLPKGLLEAPRRPNSFETVRNTVVF